MIEWKFLVRNRVSVLEYIISNQADIGLDMLGIYISWLIPFVWFFVFLFCGFGGIIRLAHPGGPLKTNKAAALAKFLERKLQDPSGLASINPDLIERAVKNAKETIKGRHPNNCLFFTGICYFYPERSFLH